MIKIVVIRAGTDVASRHLDTQIVFLADTNKVTCHFYNTTQRVLINGKGYKKFINLFLKSFFQGRVDACVLEIEHFNITALKQLGVNTVKRSEVRYNCHNFQDLVQKNL